MSAKKQVKRVCTIFRSPDDNIFSVESLNKPRLESATVQLHRAETANTAQRWDTGWMIGVLGFDSWRGLGIFIITASRTALEPTQPPIQWVPGALSLGVKRPGREDDYSSPSSAEVKECVELPPLPQYAFMASFKELVNNRLRT
jgi:hypothetical protein